MRGKPTPEDQARRQPITAIPEDFLCLACQRKLESEAAFRGHMWQSHGALYARREPSKNLAQLKEPENLPENRTTLEPWMAIGLAQHILFGKSFQQIASDNRGGRGVDTLRAVAASPAGEALRAKIADIVGSPLELCKLLLQDHMVQGVVDHLAAKEWAREARDYKALHAMNRDVDLLPYLEAMKKPTDSAAPTLVVNFSGGRLDVPEVRSDYVVVEADAHPEE